jgi:hypothetical protein
MCSPSMHSTAGGWWLDRRVADDDEIRRSCVLTCIAMACGPAHRPACSSPSAWHVVEPLAQPHDGPAGPAGCWAGLAACLLPGAIRLLLRAMLLAAGAWWRQRLLLLAAHRCWPCLHPRRWPVLDRGGRGAERRAPPHRNPMDEQRTQLYQSIVAQLEHDGLCGAAAAVAGASMIRAHMLTALDTHPLHRSLCPLRAAHHPSTCRPSCRANLYCGCACGTASGHKSQGDSSLFDLFRVGQRAVESSDQPIGDPLPRPTCLPPAMFHASLPMWQH